MSANEQLQEMYRQQVIALQTENYRLNEVIKEFKRMALKARISDPNFDKPLSEIETKYEIVTP
jgi:exonuclease VII small subunit